LVVGSGWVWVSCEHPMLGKITCAT
jgi:hypothetical protein